MYISCALFLFCARSWPAQQSFLIVMVGVFTSALCTFYNYCLPFLYLCPHIVICQLLTLDGLNQPCLYHLPTSESVSQVLPYLVTLSYCTFIQVWFFFFFMFFEHCPGRISVVVQMFMLKQFIGVMREPFVDYWGDCVMKKENYIQSAYWYCVKNMNLVGLHLSHLSRSSIGRCHTEN